MNNKKNIIDQWLQSAEQDLNKAQSLLDDARYDWCVFFCHSVIEKALKAYYVYVNNAIAPETHDLVYLAKNSGINLDEKKIKLFNLLKGFYMEANNPKEGGWPFYLIYRRCDIGFARRNLELVEEIYKWLKSTLIY